jgi:hypothetical protein
LNAAVTAAFPATVTLHGEVVQAPLQPAKVEPPAGVGVSVTVVPGVKPAEQEVPQVMPDGLEATVPLPVPVLLTVRAYVNVAVTDFPVFIVTVQVPVPVHTPPHPAKIAPLTGAAVRVTVVPL